MRRIVLIRAVNVGGAKLPMADLRSLATDLGATSVSTYIASGNLLCDLPDGADKAAFDRGLEQRVEERFGFFREVISRSPAKLRADLEGFPFEVHDPARCYVHALLAEPDAGAADRLRALDVGDDEWRLRGSTMWIRYAAGAGSSTLTAAAIARRLGVQGTARNLRTVQALLDRA